MSSTEYRLFNERALPEESSVLFSPFTLSPPSLSNYSNSSSGWPTAYNNTRTYSSPLSSPPLEVKYTSSSSSSSSSSPPPVLTSSIDGSTLITSDDVQRIVYNEERYKKETKGGWCKRCLSKILFWIS